MGIVATEPSTSNEKTQAEGPSPLSGYQRRMNSVSPAWRRTLGATIRARRRQAGLTLDELAAKTGVSKPYLSLIETGKYVSRISDECLRRIAGVLELDVGEVVARNYLNAIPRELWARVAQLIEE